MSAPDAPAELTDVFLSHHSADKPWVRSLRDELVRHGLSAWLDERELPEQDNFVEGLSAAGLCRCRFLVLVVTRHSLNRPWVKWEWSTFMALSGPLGRVIPVLLEDVTLPPALAATQAIRAAGRPVAEVAALIEKRIARLRDVPDDDPRRLALGQLLAFQLRRDGDRLLVVSPDGAARPADTAAVADPLRTFRRLVRTPVGDGPDRADLARAAEAVGRALYGLLFDEAGRERLRQALAPGDRALLHLCAGDDDLLALPWELLHDGDAFLVRDGRLDLVRTTPDGVAEAALLRPPEGPFRLVVNVSAPVGVPGLSYEDESYRLALALTERCPMTVAELGTLDDLAATAARVGPTGVHFSGHGGPGLLVFEDDDGEASEVPVAELAERLRREMPNGRLPPFFYLACCHGNDGDDGGAELSAARLHRAGVAQVVGYSGPIADVLSTRAEVALYGALAAGHATRHAVRAARNALLRWDGEAFPFAWSQLVLYHRGPDHPLGTAVAAGRQAESPPRRTFDGRGRRRVLKTGFIGRRRELHRVRRHLLRDGKRVLVLQGLGGLGKSTLAFHVPPLLGAAPADVCVLWCEGAEKDANPVEALVGQLLEYCRKRFGAAWEEVVQQVDRGAERSVDRFAAFLNVLLANVPRLVLLLDNLESLLVGPAEAPGDRPDEGAFGAWKSDELRELWRMLRETAAGSDKLWLIATCRYQNDDLLAAGTLLPVTPLPPDALFRLTGWFETLQQLATPTRARLANRLDGHPRAVEYAEDLVRAGLDRRRRKHGEWRLPQPPSPADLEREWAEVVAPVLPEVREKLWANLLLGAIWDNVLDERQRRMLWRMTLLRRPWDWGLMAHLGEADEEAAVAETTAEELCRTSLLEVAEVGEAPHYTLHPATAMYVRERQPDDAGLRRETHRRVGTYLEEQRKTTRRIDTYLEAGHHLFEAGEYDRAYELLGTGSDWLRDRGRVREGLRALEPFLADGVQQRMDQPLVGRLFGTVGLAYADLGQPQRAIEFHEQHLAIAREVGDRAGEGRALGNLGNAYADLGQPQRAIEFYQQDLAIAREVGDRRGEGRALGNLGIAYKNLGQPQRAIEFYQQHLAIAREVGDRAGEGRACWNLGLQFVKLDRLAEAIPLMEVCVRFEREIGHPDADKDAAYVEQLRQRLAGG
jgi:tetratricopeptide (TPR) repeat protein